MMKVQKTEENVFWIDCIVIAMLVGILGILLTLSIYGLDTQNYLSLGVIAVSASTVWVAFLRSMTIMSSVTNRDVSALTHWLRGIIESYEIWDKENGVGPEAFKGFIFIFIWSLVSIISRWKFIAIFFGVAYLTRWVIHL